MFEVFYDVLLNGAPYALTSTLVLRLYRNHPRINRIWWISSLPALAIAVLILYTEYSLHLERQVNGILAGMALSGFILAGAGMPYSGFGIFSNRKSSDLASLLTGSSFFLLASWGWPHVLRAGMFLIRRSSESVGGIDQGLLARWLGLSLGLLLLLFLCNAIYRYLDKLEDRKIQFSLLFFLLLLFAKNTIDLLYGLLIMKVYNPGDFMYEIIVRHMNFPEGILFLLLGAGVIAAFIALAKIRMPLPREDHNPAERRKIRAKVIKKRNSNRWVLLSLAMILSMGTVGYIAANTEQEIRPSTRIAMESNNSYTVLKEDLEDGHIHRYTWESPCGVDIIFWLIKKRENNYGVVFDGCEICGPAGYLERGSDVVCVACDVIMNRNTIGLKGGCNPIPIGNFTDNEASITVLAEDLLTQEGFFQGMGVRQ